MARYSDHFTKFKTGYIMLTKDKTLTTLVKFVQDIVIPLGLHFLHLCADGGGEFIADHYRGYCKTTVIIRQFTLPNITERNSLSERNARTIMN